MRLRPSDGEAGAGGSAPGLVSSSTTHTRIPVVVEWAENTIEIDPIVQRVTNLRKAVGLASRSLETDRRADERMVMVTLTYAGTNENWRASHIRAYLTHVRNWMSRHGHRFRYVWVAELQERGVIHYHVAVWMPKGLMMPKADKRGWWPHGMTRTERVNKPIGYLMSYVSKVTSKTAGTFPRGARIHGAGGLTKDGRAVCRWQRWPRYLQRNAACGDPWKRRKGGGFQHAETGEILLSEFAPTGGGFRHFVRIRVAPRVFDNPGAFSWWNAGAGPSSATSTYRPGE